jgi:hypothetical protein
VANLNVYLGPYDSWVGSVFDTSGDGTGAAAIATNDNSCTVPAFPLAPVPGTLHALTFSNANYSQGDYGTPTGTDHGPTNLARTREGFFEIIEMGEVVDQATGSLKTLEAITPVAGKPPGCAQVQNAWGTAGYWTRMPPPICCRPLAASTRLVSSMLRRHVIRSTTAIDGQRCEANRAGQHAAESQHCSDGYGARCRDSYVPIGNSMVEADYPASTQSVVQSAQC